MYIHKQYIFIICGTPLKLITHGWPSVNQNSDIKTIADLFELLMDFINMIFFPWY